MDDLRETAEIWLAEDPDPGTQAELRALLDAGDDEALAACFAAPLEFGTAGLRGPLGPGPARMNRAVVRRVSAGVAARLAQDAEALEHGVVIGYDARHGSAGFADEAAAVFAGVGFTVHRFDEVVPTPLLAFAVRYLGAAGGVMVTASHNPPADNGYKVYWSGGAQIAEPLDEEILAAIAETDPIGSIPLSDVGVRKLGPEVREAYLEAALGLAGHPQHRDLGVVYTPLHGVAGDLVLELLERAGFTDVRVVEAQAAPDPDFPTVTFPNPEEPGALDLALEVAADSGADLVVANDPDGDRIALAVPAAGGWRLLSGDETGCLLAEELLARGDTVAPAVATTVVSSALLEAVAAHHDARYEATLTGFKWLARAADRMEAAGYDFVLAYEQALGVMCGNAVRDKDGISAALVAADLAAARRAAGSDLLAALDELALRHGVHATTGRTVRLDGPDETLVAAALERLREDPPQSLGGLRVVAFEDRKARHRILADGTSEPLDTPATELVGVVLEDGSRVQVRPSGTEPLLKFYAEVVERVDDGDVGAARITAGERVERLADAFVAAALGETS